MTKTFLLAFLMLTITTVTEARLFIVPKIGTGSGIADPFRPKYADLCDSSANVNYAYQPFFLSEMSCSPDAELFISQQADVLPFPTEDQLDNNLTALNVASMQGALELLKIPANGLIDETYTWRKVARQVAGMFLYMQRVNATGANIVFDSSLALNTTWANLDPNVKTSMQAAADSLGFDSSAIKANPNQTLRNALKLFSNQWSGTSFQLNDLTL